MENTLRRIADYAHIKGMTNAQIDSDLGLSKGAFSKQLKNNKTIGVDKVEYFLHLHKDINPEWLLTGKGGMLKSREDIDIISEPCPTYGKSKTSKTCLLPSNAKGGALDDFLDSIKAEDCEQIETKVLGADFAMRVQGFSMEPTFPDGGIVFLKKVNEKAFIEWGQAYVLDTCNGTIIKKVKPDKDEDYIICESINPDFEPFRVAKKDIYGWYRAYRDTSDTNKK